MSLPDPVLNPNAQASSFVVGHEGSTILVIDDVFGNAAEIEAYGRREAAFVRPPTFYPGLNAPLTQAFMTQLAEGLLAPLAATFGLSSEEAKAENGYFGLVTIMPRALHIMQTIPHVDNLNGRSLAVLVFLCDETQGGTGFYRHRSTGIERQTPATIKAYDQAMRSEMANLVAPGYTVGDHPLFERIGKVDLRYNRLAVYNSNLLHSGQVNPSRLSSDPAIGRLTLNLFLGAPTA